MIAIKLIKKIVTLIIMSIVMAAPFSSAYATPADENFDDDSALSVGASAQFTNDGIKYTLGGTLIGTLITNNGTCPLGDNGADYYMSAGTDASLKIEAEDASNFFLRGFAIDAMATTNILITPSGGSAVVLVSNDSWVTQTVDLSANAEFMNVSSVTISGDNLILSIDDLDFSAAVLPTHTVTYNGNTNTGGAVPTDGSSYTNGDTVTVLGNTGSLVKTGYTFNGWNTAANGTGTSYNGGNTFAMGSSDVTLYAQWSPIDYTVTYNGNTNTAGAVPTDDNTYNITDTVTVLGNTGSLAKTGYTFTGWNTAANGTGTSYNGGDTFAMGSSNVTLYAQWTENTYSVTYNGNSNTAGAVPTDATSYHNGDTATVLGNTGSLVKTGYTFNGWNSAANGTGTSYNGGDTFAIATANVTLYAQWSPIDYTVTYNGNTNTAGAVPTDGNTYNIADTVTVLGNTGSLAKTGYTFTGWNTAANGTGTSYNGGDTFAMGSSNVTLYAQWTENTYSVTYNGNSNTAGAVPTDATSYHNGDTATVLGNTGSLVKTGYTFNGWNSAANGTGTSYNGGDTFAIATANVTLYAQWSPIDYTVTYNGNTNTAGAVPTDGNTYNITDTVTVLGNTGSLAKTGYTFTGWNTAANGTGTSYNGGDTFAMGSSNVTLYAQWTENTYSVTYNGNSNTAGAVPTDATSYHNGDTATVLGNTGSLVKTGYTFNGWNSAANGTGTSYNGGDTFAIATANVTLYAQWSPIDYTVTYNGNTNTAGAVPTDGNTYNITDTVTVLGNTGSLAKTGYTFTGWNTAANGTGTSYNGGDTFAMGSSNVTLYAQWTENTYSVTYNGNSNTAGAVPTDATSYHNGDTATVLGNTGSLVKTGYTFTGWNTAANGTGTSYASGDIFSIGRSNVALYAYWVIDDQTFENITVNPGETITNEGTINNLNNAGTVLGGVVGGESHNSGILDGVTISQECTLDNQSGIVLNSINEGTIHGGAFSGNITNNGAIIGTDPNGYVDPAYTATIETETILLGGTISGNVINRGTLMNVAVVSGTRIVFEQAGSSSNFGVLRGMINLLDATGNESRLYVPNGVRFPEVLDGNETEVEFTFESLRAYALNHGWDEMTQINTLSMVRTTMDRSLPQLPTEFFLVDGIVISEEGIIASDGTTLDIAYDTANIPAGFDEEDLLVLNYDTQDGAWKQISFVNTGNQHLSITTKTLTSYAICLNRADELAAGVIVGSLNGTIDEDAGIATFGLALTRQPTHDVYVSLSVSNETEALINPGDIIFTPNNFDVQQVITITGVDDDLVDGDVSFSIIISSLVSEDSNYNGLNPTDLVVVNLDNDIPQLILPVDGGTGIELMPVLQMTPFGIMDSNFVHTQTHWQISLDPGFTDDEMVLNLISAASLESLSVPALVLDKETTYFWRVKAYNANGNDSSWSQPNMFTTVVSAGDDLDENGIPDGQAVSDTEDLDQDGTPDNQQNDILSITSAVDGKRIGVKAGTNTIAVLAVTAINADTISDTMNKPETLDMGLVGFKILVPEPGDTAEVTIYLSEAMAEDAHWYKYTPAGGWQDFTGLTSFSADDMSATIRLTDGGEGDLDGVANGIIIDPSGPDALAPTPTVSSSSGGGGCFISLSADWKKETNTPWLNISLLMAILMFLRIKKYGNKDKRNSLRYWKENFETNLIDENRSC